VPTHHRCFDFSFRFLAVIVLLANVAAPTLTASGDTENAGSGHTETLRTLVSTNLGTALNTTRSSRRNTPPKAPIQAEPVTVPQSALPTDIIPFDIDCASQSNTRCAKVAPGVIRIDVDFTMAAYGEGAQGNYTIIGTPNMWITPLYWRVHLVTTKAGRDWLGKWHYWHNYTDEWRWTDDVVSGQSFDENGTQSDTLTPAVGTSLTANNVTMHVYGYWIISSIPNPDISVIESASLRNVGECLLATYPDARGTCGDPIDTLTGTYSHNFTDLSLSTSAGELTFGRSYSSAASYLAGLLGYGWTNNQDTHLIFYPAPYSVQGSVIFQSPLGNQYVFKIEQDGTYTAAPGLLMSLSRSTDTPPVYTITTSRHSKFMFDSNGKLTTHLDSQGHAFSYQYDGQSRLFRVIADDGTRFLQFDYDTSNRIHVVSAHTDASQISQVSYGYDSGTGDLTSFTDVMNQTWTYAYDANHHLTEIIDPDSKDVVRNHYDNLGRADTQYDGRGNIVASVVYNADGTSTVVDKGIQRTDIYDARGLKTKTVDALGRETDTVYDTNFRPISISNASAPDEPLSVEWSTDGVDLFQKTDPAGGTTINHYDALHNLTYTKDPNGGETTYTYDGRLLTTKVDAMNGTTHYTYWPEGWLKSETTQDGQITQYTYNLHGQKISATDPLGNTTTYTYDELGRLIDTTDSRGRVTHNVYDAAGKLLSTTANYNTQHSQNDQNIYNIVTSYTYDHRGHQTSSTDTYGNPTQYVYYDNGLLWKTIDALNYVTTNYYDEAGQLDHVIDANNHTTSYVYDAVGRRLSTIDALGHSSGTTTFDVPNNKAIAYDGLSHPATYYYDSLERVVKVVDAQNHTTLTSYDANGNVTSRTDARNRTTRYTYDALNRMVRTTFPDQIHYTSTVYDPVTGYKTDTVDAMGHITHYDYDDYGRLIATTDPLGHTTQTEYDEHGRRSATVDAAGRRTTYTYDLLDRVIEVTDPTGSTLTEYDALGRVLTTTDANQHSAHTTYDELGRVDTTTDANGNITYYDYDPVGNLLWTQDPLGHKTYYGYDDANRRVSVTDPENNTTSTAYDALGNVTDQTDANGVVTHTDYDSLNRPVDIIRNYRPGVEPNAEINVRTEFTYNEVGNRITVKDPNGHITHFEYDEFNRVTKKIDPLENTWLYTYDANGNQTIVTNANGQSVEYTYNADNELIGIDYPGS
jgi:YD repeat-containing protein